MASFYQNQSSTQNITNSLLLFESSLKARLDDEFLKSTQAYRLFNGFYEGIPGLIADRFAQTLLIKNFASESTPAATPNVYSRKFMSAWEK